MTSRKLFRVFALILSFALPVAARAQTSAVQWRTNLDAAKIEAIKSNRLLLVHFSTNSCAPCKIVEQNVFSQQHVGAAMEQDYVPVRVDADASPALARAFRIDRVPMEVVMTPQGNVVATLSVPDKPEAYLAQLQNLARHFRQTTGGGVASAQPSVNPAYAGLPVPHATSNAGGPQAMVDQRSAAAGQPDMATAPPSAQVQSNPYMPAAPNPAIYGQAQNVYAPSAQDRYQQAGVQQAPPQQPQAPPQVAQQPAPPAVAAGANTYAAVNPTMPYNAMPRSYRNPLTDTAAAPAIAAGIAAATPPAAAQPATTYPAGVPNTQVAIAPVTPAPSQAGSAQTAPTPSASVVNPPAMSAAQIGAIAAAASPTITPPKPPVPQMPAGAPPLAFDGCCPVTLKTLKRWTIGDAQFGAIHRGRTYIFAGAAQRDQFLADPDAYSPVFAGLDPVLLLEKQQSVAGTRQYGFEYGGSFYLFSGKESMDKFAASPHSYAAGVRQAMSRIDASTSTDVIRR